MRNRLNRHISARCGLMMKAVIFDLDGVIAETEHIHIQAEKQAMLKYGVKISEDELHQYTGTTVNKCSQS